MRPEEALVAEQNMLKFLTHKLRTHSLNEDQVVEKVDGRDSGTESDDELERADVGSTSRSSSSSLAESACSTCSSALPAHARASSSHTNHELMYDHNSSEEELEVINGAPLESFRGEPLSRRRGTSSPGLPAAPEKRKWSAMENNENNVRTASSSDDDTEKETPVRFRTSPPLEALKPRRGRAPGRPLSPLAQHNACPYRAEPLHKQAHLEPPHETSPRKRTRHVRRHRPCLDFDKMQQLKVRGVTAWRHHGGSHAGGGELSVFCW